MAKKVNQTFRAHLTKNTLVDKGGAWLLNICIQNEGDDKYLLDTYTAWSNPSAAKRYVKQVVLDNTPRKSVKMTIMVSDKDTNKPLVIDGTLTYKVEA
jgi:hypothetical protein